MENQPVMIKDIRQGMKNLVMTVIVLDVGPPVQVKEREVRTLKVADGTACINLSLWGEAGNHVCPGDIIRMSKAHVNVYRNCVTLLNGKSCEIDKIGEFCMVFNEQVNMSEPNLDLVGAQGTGAGKNGAPPHGLMPAAAQSGGVGPQNPLVKPLPLGGPPPRPLPPQQPGIEPPMNKGPNKMNCGGNGNKSLPPPRGGGPGGGMKSSLPRPDRR